MEMSVLFIVLSAILVFLCVGTITMILLQRKRDAGFGGSMTGQGGSHRDAYYDTNKARTFEGMLERYTKVAFVLILVVTILIAIVQPSPEVGPFMPPPGDIGVDMPGGDLGLDFDVEFGGW